MSETPTPPDHTAVKTELAAAVLNHEALKDNDELDASLRTQEAIAGDVTHLRTFLVGQEGEESDELQLEQAALREAVTAVATNHEGVSETLIMLWINGEEIGNQMVGLHENGIRTYADLLEDEDSIRTIQRIGVELGLDLGETGESGDGVDGSYGARTREAWAQVQQALVDAGYNLGEFRENNDGVDGAVGQVTMNVLLQAARGVAPDDVVDAAVEAAEDGDETDAPLPGHVYSEAEAAAAAPEVSPLPVARPGSAEETAPEAVVGDAMPENMIDSLSGGLAADQDGIEFDHNTNLFTHHLTGATITATEIIGTNEGEVEAQEARTNLESFNQEQLQAFAEENNLTYSEGRFYFPERTGYDRVVNMTELLAADDPAAYLADQGADPVNEESIPLHDLQPLMQRVSRTDGVQAINANSDGYNVVLFDGSEVDLAEIYQDYGGGQITLLTRFEILQNHVNQATESVADTHDLDFRPEVTDPAFRPAQFSRDGQVVFRLSELDNGAINESLPLRRHSEAGEILQQVLDGLPSSD